MKPEIFSSGQQIVIPARDGFPLGATLFPAAGESATGSSASRTGVLIVNSATATPQTFYYALAEYLAARGITVLTYDYRGIGRSRPPGPLSQVEASMRSWAFQDVAAAIDWSEREFPGRQLMALGHSYGGQVLGLLPNAAKLERTVLVASQLGYWGGFSPRHRPRAWFGVSVLIPGLSHLNGYFPGSKVGLGEDLPKGVALEWARWCRSPNYLFDHLSREEKRAYDRFAAPMLAFKFTDDTFASAGSVEALLSFYPAAHGRAQGHRRPKDRALRLLPHPVPRHALAGGLRVAGSACYRAQSGQRVRGRRSATRVKTSWLISVADGSVTAAARSRPRPPRGGPPAARRRTPPARWRG